jgi:hypothetical protein
MNNIKPYFWGPHFWETLFNICALFPDEPNENFKNSTKMYMLSLKELLPCYSCRKSYELFSTEKDTDITNDLNYSTKENFSKLIYLLRNKVNNKLGLEYNITLDYFKIKLDKMICSSKHDMDSYANNVSDAPFIQKELMNVIFDYLKNNNKNKEFKLDHTKKIIEKTLEFIKKPVFEEDNKLFKFWVKRNTQCYIIIKKIYNNMAIGNYDIMSSFTKDNNLHIKLFLMGCSIIPSYDLKKILLS